MTEETKEIPIRTAEAPAAAAPEGEAGESKKGAKKAAAKAKKEAEKAAKAAEREKAAQVSSAAGGEDVAKENYGDSCYPSKISGLSMSLGDLAKEHVGKPIEFHGFLQTSRKQGAKMVFLELRAPGGGIGANVQDIQAIAAENTEGEDVVSRTMIKWIGGISLESAVEVQAIVKEPLEPVKSVSIGGFELHIQRIYLVASAPIQLAVSHEASSNNEAAIPGPTVGFATLLDNPAMRFRGTMFNSIAKVRNVVDFTFRSYMEENGFVLFYPPAMIGAASEGGANVFKIKYFETDAFLAQSPQFYKQMKIAGGQRRVYCVSPVFRAENANTSRHMTEFIGLDMEMQIEKDYSEVLLMLQGFLLRLFNLLPQKCRAEIDYIRKFYPSEEFLLPEPGKELILSFAEGQKLLREEGPEEFRNVSDDDDMSTPQEKALGALIKEKFKTDFYVLDKFPTSARPFYAYTDPANPNVTNAYDFFMRGQEILSGGQRFHKPEELEASMRNKGVDPNAPGLKEYVDVFRSVGCPKHGGGGIGLDRIVAWYLNLPNVQMVADFPRMPNRLFP
ncbi:aspartyl-tRNA synthetase-like protein [Calycina marina]|uniref:Probable aspartate--tRNA ligase, cytoplasmic n=1 Tax=Calycina marina TaxID=1763456 RepID=A0A9P7Z0Y9_9HELO|nr:aspartyl-tRNA synthetase-like protein [Calycina marina]